MLVSFRRTEEKGFNVFGQLENAFSFGLPSWGVPSGAAAQPVPEEPAQPQGDGEKSPFPGFGKGLFREGRQGEPPTDEELLFVETAELTQKLAAITAQVSSTPEATQGQILSQSPTDATRFWWHLYGS